MSRCYAPSFRRGLADDDPLVPRLRSRIIRSGGISRPFPVNHRQPCSYSVHVGSVSHAFPARKRFKGFKRPERDAICQLSLLPGA